MTRLPSSLPDLNKLDLSIDITEGSHLIMAAGFEDRALGFLQQIVNLKAKHLRKFHSVSVISYSPMDQKNERNKKKIYSLLTKIGVRSTSIHEFNFDREHPLEFSETLNKILHGVGNCPHIYLDISAMSKLLILYLLKGLWDRGLPFSIIYSEARYYSPSKKEFQISFKKGHFGQNILMEFLFSGVFEPIIPPEFAGGGPLGRGSALVLFLGYNKRQSIGAASVVPYQILIPVVGVPPDPSRAWRVNALIEINDEGLLASGKPISGIPRIQPDDRGKDVAAKGEFRVYLSTLDYKDTVNALLWIKNVYQYSHFLTIAPFGSKLQTLGTFVFTRLYPETQIVYATPKDFHPRYSKGVTATYRINFAQPKMLEKKLLHEINPNLAELERLANSG